MLQVFHDQNDILCHDQFQLWRRQNPSGKFLTRETRSVANLHGAQCQHLGSTDWSANRAGLNSLTKKMKIVGKADGDLRDWAAQNSVDVHLCSHCVRDGFIDDSFFDGAASKSVKAVPAGLEVAGDDWSKAELRASVEAYVDMQRKHRAGDSLVKKRYYEDLSQRFGRTAKSFEFRMQNISYVLSLMGREWLTGLKPARNVGANVAAIIEALIGEVEGRKSVPVAAFEIAVREEAKLPLSARPQGNRTPKSNAVEVTQYLRDAAVKAWVLKHASGVCECCRNQAPFEGIDGRPFLEVHHVHQLADGGSDTTTNAVALCPNCHRQLHYGMNAGLLIEGLFKSVSRLVSESAGDG